MEQNPTIGDHLRAWRRRRRLSQLDLALDAGITQKHLSFVESGRAAPSRDMVLRLAEHLDVPLRERNALLLAAGFAPHFGERPLDGPALAAARRAIDRLLRAHEPNPALAVDRHWRMIAANAMVAPLLAGVRDADLLRPPVDVMRLTLAPGGLAPRIVNLAEWRAHLLERVRRQAEVTGDPVLHGLAEDLARYPGPTGQASAGSGFDGIVVPLVLDTAFGRMSFISTTTVFGTPLDVTLSEIALETFFPADEATAAALRHIAQAEADAGEEASEVPCAGEPDRSPWTA